MIYPKKILKYFKAIQEDRVITIDYPWKPKSRYDQQQVIASGLQHIVEKNEAEADQWIKMICRNLNHFKDIPLTLSDQNGIYWENNYLPGLDIISLYTFVQELNPGKIIEIGSGHSTSVMRSSIQANRLQSKLISIDPHPRREIQSLANEWIIDNLESLVDFSLFKNLSPGDIVFFDGSHMSLPNSDVTVFFLEILPIIPKGVFVQIHDIYLPYDYPDEMVHRGYNEQYLLAMALIYGLDKYEVIFPAWYTYQRQEAKDMLQQNLWSHLPNSISIEKHGGSFWFKIK